VIDNGIAPLLWEPGLQSTIIVNGNADTGGEVIWISCVVPLNL
jgi:hypothetical protein